MATLQINMENGFFTSTNGRYVTEVTPTHVAGNGWDCTIREDGSIVCEATRDYSDGIHSMRYEIARNGFAKLTLKVEGQPVQTLRKGFVLPRGAKLTDGVIGLAGGYVDERYAYFRDGAFQKFLNKFGITAVKHEDPNHVFVVRNARYGGGECHSSLVSDGVVTEVGYDSGRTDGWHVSCPGTCAYEGETSYEVTGATWAIHTQDMDEGDCHNYARILYTQVRNVADLESSLMGNKEINLDVIKREQTARLHSLDKRVVFSVDDIREVVRQVIEIAPKMKSKLDDDSKSEEFLHCFDLTGGYQYKVETWGPMPNNPYADFEVRIVCDGRILEVAEGDLG